MAEHAQTAKRVKGTAERVFAAARAEVATLKENARHLVQLCNGLREQCAAKDKHLVSLRTKLRLTAYKHKAEKKGMERQQQQSVADVAIALTTLAGPCALASLANDSASLNFGSGDLPLRSSPFSPGMKGAEASDYATAFDADADAGCGSASLYPLSLEVPGFEAGDAVVATEGMSANGRRVNKKYACMCARLLGCVFVTLQAPYMRGPTKSWFGSFLMTSGRLRGILWTRFFLQKHRRAPPE